jgi:putative pyruvate formate lyase activating enzyme
MALRHLPTAQSSVVFPDSVFEPLSALKDCTCCPRECHADRLNGLFGYCNSGAGFAISSICAHRGEEPVISGRHGICNIFFARCNMSCVYCQNWQISRSRGKVLAEQLTLEQVCDQIESVLNCGSKLVGFVSPSHYVPQVKVIMRGLEARGRRPVYVYNTSSYDKVDTVKSFDDLVDVWLPDLKYLDDKVGVQFSDTPNYPAVATAAVREMFYQKGSNIRLDADGSIESGLIIRHLVLPGKVDNSRKVLRWIAENLSINVHISLMSQYHPTEKVKDHPLLNRTLHVDEYNEVLEEFHSLGFHNGWVQELDSPTNYRPDFTEDHPFEY